VSDTRVSETTVVVQNKFIYGCRRTTTASVQAVLSFMEIATPLSNVSRVGLDIVEYIHGSRPIFCGSVTVIGKRLVEPIKLGEHGCKGENYLSNITHDVIVCPSSNLAVAFIHSYSLRAKIRQLLPRYSLIRSYYRTYFGISWWYQSCCNITSGFLFFAKDCVSFCHVGCDLDSWYRCIPGRMNWGGNGISFHHIFALFSTIRRCLLVELLL